MCRKNKTLSAIFRQSSTLALLEQNYQVYQALHKDVAGGTVDLAAAVSRMAMDGPAEEEVAAAAEADDGDGDGMEEDEQDKEGGSRQQQGGHRKRGKASEGFKQQVLEVLEQGGFASKRAAKMTQDEFLQLLAAFNAACIHFA